MNTFPSARGRERAAGWARPVATPAPPLGRDHNLAAAGLAFRPPRADSTLWNAARKLETASSIFDSPPGPCQALQFIPGTVYLRIRYRLREAPGVAYKKKRNMTLNMSFLSGRRSVNPTYSK